MVDLREIIDERRCVIEIAVPEIEQEMNMSRSRSPSARDRSSVSSRLAFLVSG